MKLSRGFATALLLALAGALVAHASVITLTQSNFNQVVGSSDFIAVEFFAPWCGHCKRLEPEWKSAAETFANDPPEELAVEVKLAAVDATAETGLATKYGVRGYPTIKIFRKGNVNDAQEYAGPRDAAGIVQYLTSLAGPASLKVSSAAEAEKLIDKHAVVVFAVGTAALEAHNIVADDLRSGPYKFAHVDSHAQLPKNMNHGGAPIVVVRSFDDPVVTFSGPFDDAEVLSNFVQDAAIPALVMLSPDPIYEVPLQRVFGNTNPKIIVFTVDWSDATKAAVIAASRALDGQADVIGANFAEGERAAGFFGVEKGDMPVVAAHNPATDQKFIGAPRAAVTAAAIETFARGVIDGTLEAHIKSEPVPTSNDGPVRVIVASTFEEEVMGGKDVMIEFYAPWCGHCKNLAPTYEDVARWANKETNVVVAKMDATVNDVTNRKFTVTGFPTIYFVEGATGDVVLYEGDRTLEAFKSFILQHQTVHDEL